MRAAAEAGLAELRGEAAAARQAAEEHARSAASYPTRAALFTASYLQTSLPDFLSSPRDRQTMWWVNSHRRTTHVCITFVLHRSLLGIYGVPSPGQDHIMVSPGRCRGEMLKASR